MVFVTGDCHGKFNKLSASSFPEQKEMTKDDIVIICGDFGAVWNVDGVSPSEAYWLKWLDQKPFTTVFVDGNHENFDRLNSEFEVIGFHGGKAHRLNSSVYHLLRGEIFEFEGKSFFAFGGAASHDIDDGILYREDFNSMEELREKARRMCKLNRKYFRINRETWWQEELPSDAEIEYAEQNLKKADYRVDYVITHCAPRFIVSQLSPVYQKPDRLMLYFEDLSKRLSFINWYFGHYHDDREFSDKYVMLKKRVIRIL